MAQCYWVILCRALKSTGFTAIASELVHPSELLTSSFWQWKLGAYNAQAPARPLYRDALPGPHDLFETINAGSARSTPTRAIHAVLFPFLSLFRPHSMVSIQMLVHMCLKYPGSGWTVSARFLAYAKLSAASLIRFEPCHPRGCLPFLLLFRPLHGVLAVRRNLHAHIFLTCHSRIYTSSSPGDSARCAPSFLIRRVQSEVSSGPFRFVTTK